MARTEAILEAVLRIHEAPLAPDGWTRALPSIAAALESQVANFHVQNSSGGTIEFVAGHGLDPDHFARFRCTANAGRLPQHWQSLPTGTIAQRSVIWPDREFVRSVFYNEVVRATNTWHAIQTPLIRMPERHVHLLLARETGCEDYEDEDIAAMQTLVPHLVTALRAGFRLAGANLRAAGAGTALDCLDAGVVIVDAAARILFANRRSEAILARNDGLCTEKGGVYTTEPRSAALLRRLIDACANVALAHGGRGDGGTIDIPRRAGRTPLHIVVSPLPPESINETRLGLAKPVAILVVTDPEEEQRLQKERICRRFGLTPAEADVALEIVKCDGRAGAAARLGIAVSTVRTHLIHIFAKTGVRRQAELVRLFLKSQSNIPGA